jgi:hypothetical protein
VDARTWLRAALDPALLFDLAGYTPDAWQRDAMRTEADRVGLLVARQCGKSLAAVMKAIHRATFFEASLVLMTAPSERQATELLRKWKDNYRRLDQPIPIVRELETVVELANGSRTVALPGDPLTIRCYSGVNMVIIDEAAMVANDGLFHAVMPMLFTTRGSCWMLSTPMGKRGFYYDTYSSRNPDWAWIVGRATECPRIDPAFLAEQRRTFGERWYQQEYGCEFVDTFGSVFSAEEVEGMFGDHSTPLLEGF